MGRQLPKIQLTFFVSTLRFGFCSPSLGPGFEVCPVARGCFHRNVSTSLRVTHDRSTEQRGADVTRTHAHCNTHASRYFIPHQRKQTRSILSFLFRIWAAYSNECVSPVQRFKIRHTAAPRLRVSAPATADCHWHTACLSACHRDNLIDSLVNF
jgi:hypothetical protein